MRRQFTIFLCFLLFLEAGSARQIQVICGTSREHSKVELFLHRQAERLRQTAQAQSTGGQVSSARPASVDMGNVAVLEDSGGVVVQPNPFNLDQQTLTFTPSAALAASYTSEVSGNSYDAGAAASGMLVRLGDDDFHQTALGFSFPFFGKSYQSIFVDSDGNLTFTEGDDASTDRSLGRMVAGPPRIAPLFRDLDPSKALKGVTVSSSASRLIVSWVQVPEYADFGVGPLQTFQVRLYPDGRIQFAYSGITTSSAVVGISPGGFQGSSSVVSFTSGGSTVYSSTVAEIFGSTTEVDIQTAAQKFFQTHDDSYDYLAFFNDEDIQAGASALAWEQTVRNSRTGYGDIPVNDAPEYGSPVRLQSVLNMGPLSQYPIDPTDPVAVGGREGYDSLKLIAHETGHLFLAYASVNDPNDPMAMPMLRSDLAHWAFNFNAEASFMEGNSIQDNGPNASPRYITTAIVDQYAPLDQYLMGFRSADEVAPTFLVTGNPQSFSDRFPSLGVVFNGDRRDISIDEIIQAAGRRTPDYTVAQRHFRMGFVLIVKQGTTPPATELAQVEGYRSQFEAYYAQASGNRGHMDAKLRRALALSVWPAAGVLAGGSITAAVSIQQSISSPVTIALGAPAGNISVPASVTIPAGQTSANFTINGVQPGVEELSATPADTSFETAYAHVQVLAQSALLLSTVSGDRQVVSSMGTIAQPVVMQVSDLNSLFYPGAKVQASASAGGTVTPEVASADANGLATFQWTPGTGANAQLQVFLQGSAPASGVTVTALPPTNINAAGVVNAASFVTGMTPGGLATIYGTTLAGGVSGAASLPWPKSIEDVSVLVNNQPAELLYVSDSQINFLAPSSLATGSAKVTVMTSIGTSSTVQVPVAAVSPGIFFDSGTNFGAILNAGTSQTTLSRPAKRGQFIEIYCTGLGAVQQNGAGLMATVSNPQVSIGGVNAPVNFSGLAPVYNGGLYQVNVQVPQNAPTGTTTLQMTIGGVQSNVVKVGIQ